MSLIKIYKGNTIIKADVAQSQVFYTFSYLWTLGGFKLITFFGKLQQMFCIYLLGYMCESFFKAGT